MVGDCSSVVMNEHAWSCESPAVWLVATTAGDRCRLLADGRTFHIFIKCRCVTATKKSPLTFKHATRPCDSSNRSVCFTVPCARSSPTLQRLTVSHRKPFRVREKTSGLTQEARPGTCKATNPGSEQCLEALLL